MTSLISGFIGLALGGFAGWLIAALLGSGKDHDMVLEDHQSKSN